MRQNNSILQGLLLLFFIQTTTAGVCPSHCSCYLDHKGRMAVSCNGGGMTGPISLTSMNTSTEVLKITAPEDNMNMLTMSPAFQQFAHLEEIHITRCNLPILGQYFFYGLKKLEVLNLSQNNISQLLDHNFRGLDNLRELNLDDNRIFSMPSGTFRYLQNLKVLSLQRNRIRELMPRIFVEVGRLRVLRLSGNNLGELNPEVFKDVQELHVLECRGCGLRKIDDMFHLLPQLAYLDLGHNEINFVAADEFQNLRKLRVLKLDGNRISTILADTFVLQEGLEVLHWTKNQLTRIDANAFRNLKNLTELDLGYNKLKDLDPNVFAPLATKLQKLILSGNHLGLHVIEIVLRDLKIEELHLAEMGFTRFEQKIFPDTVNVLHLEGNSLILIAGEALPPNLMELDISRNRFRGLNEDVVRKLDLIDKYYIHHNPWSCDLCNIVPLLERTNVSARIYDIKCVSPYTVDGKLLGTLKKNDLTWCSTPTYESGDVNYFLTTEENGVGLIAAGASVLLLSGTVIGILAILCYSRRHAAKYYTHEDKLNGERESIFENQSPLFGEDKELSFKFPLNSDEKRISISTIDEIKKEHAFVNGT